MDYSLLLICEEILPEDEATTIAFFQHRKEMKASKLSGSRVSQKSRGSHRLSSSVMKDNDAEDPPRLGTEHGDDDDNAS